MADSDTDVLACASASDALSLCVGVQGSGSCRFPFERLCGRGRCGGGGRWGWDEVDRLLKDDAAAAPAVADTAFAAAVQGGWVLATACLLPHLSSSAVAEAVDQARLLELASWARGGVVAAEVAALEAACAGAGIACGEQERALCGRRVAVLQLDTMLPGELTDLDTLLVRRDEGGVGEE
eukprot:Rhum_TRINITY_DN14798_c43_g1::Rhum_TRINITY_DN14798_c43_g1_i1::g.111145::m.111145